MLPDQPVATRKGEELDLARLNEFLSKNLASKKVEQQLQFPGGYSNLTYLLTTADAEYILRRPPAGAAIKTAHDMAREFKVLSLLRKHYQKIPTPIIYCEDPEIIGAPFYLMERLKGIILRPSAVKNIKIEEKEMRKISEALVDNLVDLHAIDIVNSGLVQLGKPEGYVQRQVDGWTKRYIASQTEKIDAMEALGKWLAAHQPSDSLPTFLHNDYKYDNIVLEEGSLTNIIGVLDWEMSTVGDPWMDLGASLAYWAEKDDDDLFKVFNVSWLPGNQTRMEVYERYVEKSRRSVTNPVFYYAFGLFKNAVIAQQIYFRWKQGHSTDPRFGKLIHVIRNLAIRGEKAITTGSL